VDAATSVSRGRVETYGLTRTSETRSPGMALSDPTRVLAGLDCDSRSAARTSSEGRSGTGGSRARIFMGASR
jgi:hypothetical protein